MILCKRWIYPQSVADNIGIWDVLQRTSGTDEDVATHNKSMERLWCLAHDVLVKRQLQIKQCLVNLLSSHPTEYWNRKRNLACSSVGRKSS